MTATPTPSDVVEGVFASIATGTEEAFVGEIAEQNLTCATGLPGSEALDIAAALVRLWPCELR